MVIMLVSVQVLTGCARISNGDIPCDVMKCTDYSSADDAWDNGVLNELCNMECEV